MARATTFREVEAVLLPEVPITNLIIVLRVRIVVGLDRVAYPLEAKGQGVLKPKLWMTTIPTYTKERFREALPSEDANSRKTKINKKKLCLSLPITQGTLIKAKH